MAADEPEVDEPEGEEEIDDARAESMMGDAETFLRHAWDLLDDLVETKKVPKSLVDKLEKLHDELVDLMPED
jgi:hypothetical protein